MVIQYAESIVPHSKNFLGFEKESTVMAILPQNVRMIRRLKDLVTIPDPSSALTEADEKNGLVVNVEASK